MRGRYYFIVITGTTKDGGQVVSNGWTASGDEPLNVAEAEQELCSKHNLSAAKITGFQEVDEDTYRVNTRKHRHYAL